MTSSTIPTLSSASPVLIPREDPIGKVVFAVIALGFGLVCFVALITLFAAVLRGPTERCRASLRDAPLQAFVAGLLGYAVLSGMAWYLLSGAFIKRILETEIVPSWLASGISVVAVLVVVTFIGAAGTVSLLGERLAALQGEPMPGLRRTALATLVAVLAGWFPVIGWFVVTPALLLFSFGAACVGLWRRIRGR